MMLPREFLLYLAFKPSTLQESHLDFFRTAMSVKTALSVVKALSVLFVLWAANTSALELDIDVLGLFKGSAILSIAGEETLREGALEAGVLL